MMINLCGMNDRFLSMLAWDECNLSLYHYPSCPSPMPFPCLNENEYNIFFSLSHRASCVAFQFEILIEIEGTWQNFQNPISIFNIHDVRCYHWYIYYDYQHQHLHECWQQDSVLY